MKIDDFSPPTQDGLRLWAKEALDDEMALDGTASEHWAWVYFQLQASPDRPKWFPKGKWATIQLIGEMLREEAAQGIAYGASEADTNKNKARGMRYSEPHKVSEERGYLVRVRDCPECKQKLGYTHLTNCEIAAQNARGGMKSDSASEADS